MGFGHKRKKIIVHNSFIWQSQENMVLMQNTPFLIAHVDVACGLRGIKSSTSILCVLDVFRETKSLMRLCVCTCLSKPSLLIDAISTKYMYHVLA